MGDCPAERLKLFRKQLGLNQRAFASSIGVSPSRIGSIESGVFAPFRKFLQKVSDTYQINADWLR